MKRTTQLLRGQLRCQVLSWSGAWWFVVALAAGQMVPALVSTAVWWTVSDDDRSMLAYYATVVLLSALTASYENFTFSENIYSGALADDLVRPQPVVLGPLAENVAVRIWIASVAVPVVAVLVVVGHVPLDLGSVLLVVVFAATAGALRFVFTWILALAAFWTDRVHSIVAFSTFLLFLLGGVAAPVEFLPDPWRTIAELAPFHAMVGLPAEVVAGVSDRTVGEVLSLQAAWTAALAALGFVVWRRGLARFTSVGA